MEPKDAVAAFAALAHDHRLAVFRLLMEAGPNGVTAGDIAARVGVPPSTLSSHLAQLERAGLLRSWRRQRFVHYAADFEGARSVIAFLTEACCRGRPELCGFAGPGTPVEEEQGGGAASEGEGAVPKPELASED